MRQSTAVLLLILAASIFAAWFFTTHEKVTRDQYIGYSGEARINDFLAADMLLNELGIEADSRESLTPSLWLPDFSDTLVTRASSTIAVGAERDLLMGWVANGGHLVLLPPDDGSRFTDELLAAFDFQLIDTFNQEDDETSEAANDEDGEEDENEDTYSYSVDLVGTRYRIESTSEDFPGATLTDDLGIVAARRQWANGHITLLGGSHFFSNFSIGESNHARLLLDAVAGYVEPGKVWFIYDAAFPSLLQVIWQNAPYVVCGFLVVLFFWLWSIMPRFGPAIEPAPAVRRSIIEHVRAAGHFAWKNRGAGSLAGSSTDAVMHEAEFRHPGIGRLNVQDQARQIAKLTDLPAQTVLDVLADQHDPKHREFTHKMRSLQRIRKRL